MGWQTPERNTISLQKKDPGFSVEGVYQGNKVVKTDLGDTMIYNFQDEEDKPFGVWAFSSLNFQMDGVKTGSRVKLTYMGKAKQKNKFGKFPHIAKVEVWKDDEEVAAEEEEPTAF